MTRCFESQQRWLVRVDFYLEAPRVVDGNALVAHYDGRITERFAGLIDEITVQRRHVRACRRDQQGRRQH